MCLLVCLFICVVAVLLYCFSVRIHPMCVGYVFVLLACCVMWTVWGRGGVVVCGLPVLVCLFCVLLVCLIWSVIWFVIRFLFVLSL